MSAASKNYPRVFLAGTFLSVHGGSRSPIEDLADRLDRSGWRSVRASSIRNKWLRAADLLSTALFRRAQYDVAVVDLYSGKAFQWGEALGVLLRGLQVPFIYTMHGGNLPAFAASRERRVAACLDRAAAVTVPSRYLQERMRPYCPNAILLPNALDSGAYSSRPRHRAAPRLIWVRRFHKIYNPSMAPQVLALVARQFPDATLIMIGADTGDGSFGKTKEAARELGVLDRIEFTGSIQREQVASHLDRCDIFINTSDVDNTPVSVLEGMAAGLCVASTDAGGLPYLLAHENDSLLTPRGNSAAMAGSVLRVLEDPLLAERMSRNARAKALECDWSKVLAEWQTLLQSTVSGRRRPVERRVPAPSA